MATDQGNSVLLIQGVEAGPIPLEEYANFIRDIVFIHDRISILAANDESRWNLYSSNWFYVRDHQRVPDENRLLLRSAEIGSPFKIGLDVKANVGDWIESAGKAFIQVLQGLVTLPDHVRQSNLDTRLQKARVVDEEQRLVLQRKQLRQQLVELPGLRGEHGDVRARKLQMDIRRISESHLQITSVEVVVEGNRNQDEIGAKDAPDQP